MPLSSRYRSSRRFLSGWFAFLLCSLTVLLSSTPLLATTWFVDISAIGTNDGSTWENASTSLVEALITVESGDEIWVAAGTYRPEYDSSGNGAPADSRTKTFFLRSGVALYGGFTGTETSRDERDTAANVTILTGDLGTEGEISDSSYHVVYASGVDASAVLDGFTITRGYANGGNFPNNCGGGMYCNSAQPSVRACTFTGNSAYIGGGMGNWTGSSPVLTSCTFSGNSASYGGGMYDLQANASLTGCTFAGNSAIYSGGALFNDTICSVMVKSCTFSKNNAVHSGGGFFNGPRCSSLVESCTFSGNQAFSGGGIYNESALTVRNSILWDDPSCGALLNTGTLFVTYSLVRGVVFPGTGNLSVDPLLGELGDNGGPTRTCALGMGSPAIDAGTAETAPLTDQRGISRPQGSGYDMGAYEAARFTVTISADLGGTVLVESYGIIENSADFSAFDTPSFVITPEDSMQITGFQVDGVSMDVVSPDGFSYTFAPLMGSHQLEVRFADLNQPGESGGGGCSLLPISGLGLLILPLVMMFRR